MLERFVSFELFSTFFMCHPARTFSFPPLFLCRKRAGWSIHIYRYGSVREETPANRNENRIGQLLSVYVRNPCCETHEKLACWNCGWVSFTETSVSFETRG